MGGDDDLKIQIGNREMNRNGLGSAIIHYS